MSTQKRLPGQTKAEYAGLVARGWDPLNPGHLARYRRSIKNITNRIKTKIELDAIMDGRDPNSPSIKEYIKTTTEKRIAEKNAQFLKLSVTKGIKPPEVGKYTTRKNIIFGSPELSNADEPVADPEDARAAAKAELQRYIEEQRAKGRPGF